MREKQMRVGLVGLGTMGGRMAQRLLTVGYSVTGYNRTPAKAQWLVEAGLELRGTPREVAESSDLVLSMVSDTAALRQVALGPAGILAGLSPGEIYVDMSTVAPAISRDLAAQASARGAAMLDAPVSGSVRTLDAGRLSIMAGGDAATLRRARPVLEAIGSKITHVGGNGHASLMKLAINLSLMVQMTAFSEGILLAERGGIPRETAIKAMLSSVIASPMIAYRADFLLDGQMPSPAWFDCAMMQKDLLLALEVGREHQVPMPTTATVNELLTACRGMGIGHQDFAVVFDFLSRISGSGAHTRR